MHEARLLTVLGITGAALICTLAAASPARAVVKAGSGGGNTLRVDDDGKQDKKAMFTSIQDAVDAASPGDTIKVAPGLYEEEVTIDTPNLTLIGPQTGNLNSRLTETPNPNQEAIVEPGAGDGGGGGGGNELSTQQVGGSDTIAFNVQASNVTINGFFVQGEAGSSQQGATGQIGIETSPNFSGYLIENNIIRGNAIGVYFNASGISPSNVTMNNISQNYEDGEISGDGIFSDQGLFNAFMSKNVFTGNPDFQIRIIGTGGQPTSSSTSSKPPGIVSVATNIMNSALNNDEAATTGGGVILSDLTNSVITSNTIIGMGNAGVVLSTGIQSATIKSNTISGSSGDGVFIGEDDGDQPTGGNVVVSNVVNNNAGDGVELSQTSGNTLQNNVIDRNQDDGIHLASATNNTIVKNVQVNNNGNDGLFADSDSTGNRISRNVLTGNVNFDIEDLTIGSGTDGTANFYTGNSFNTSSPLGLK